MRRLIVIVISGLVLVGLALPAVAGGRPLSAALSWDNEVPPAVETAATGTIHLTLNQGQGEVCFWLDTDGLSGPPLAGHIHAAPAGQNGGVVVNLGIMSADQASCVSADKDTIKQIRQNPWNYYVNVHTAVNPGGEVRGQLSK